MPRNRSRAHGLPASITRRSGRNAIVIDVSPPGFTGLDVGQVAGITVTGAALPRIECDIGTVRIGRNYRMLGIIARPRSHLSPAQAKADVATIWPTLVQGSPFEKDISFAPHLLPAATGWTGLRRQFIRPLLVLVIVVALVLLIACANVVVAALGIGLAWSDRGWSVPPLGQCSAARL